MTPCTTHPALPCAHAGRCFGSVYWLGKSEPAKPLTQVRECRWKERVQRWEAEERRNQPVAPVGQ